MIRPRIESGLEGREVSCCQMEMFQQQEQGFFSSNHTVVPLLSWPRRLIDTVVDLEESMLLFRSHHARMVERMIGRRMGTGGSSGVDYLDMTLKYRIFTDLWAVRTMLVKRDACKSRQPEFYGYASEN